jgi:hypothetical protein
LKEPEYPQVTHEQILDLELFLFDELLALAVEHPRSAVPEKGRP